jgi:hypothetical protein
MAYTDIEKRNLYAKKWRREHNLVFGNKTKEEKNEVKRLRIQTRRQNYLKLHPCKNCGSTDNLEIHHIDPELKVAHDVFGWGRARREEELAKCDVLCHNCHLAIHKAVYIHGTCNCYCHNSCRCELCTKAMRIYKRKEYRRKHNITKI